MKYQLTQPLWLLLALLPLGVLVVYFIGRFIRPSLHYHNPVVVAIPRKRYAWWKTFVLLIWCVGLAGVTLLLARPERALALETESRSVMLVLDISGSMNATDVAPNRLEAAKIGVLEFISRAPDDMQLGLVVYGAQVHLAAPITIDHAALRAAVEKIGEYDEEFRDGTATGAALLTALNGLSSAQDGLILLVSDGKEEVPLLEDNVVFMSDAVEQVDGEGFNISTIAYGTANDGADPPDPAALRAAAEATDGQFYTAATAAELDDALVRVPVVVEVEPKTVPLLSDAMWYIVLAAFGLLALATVVMTLKA